MAIDIATLLAPTGSFVSDWIGPIGGAAGLYTFVSSQWGRRVRVAVDYSTMNDADDSWHQFRITNKSDLPLTFTYFGPAWFLTTPLLSKMLGYATDMEGFDPPINVLAPRASVAWTIPEENWFVATPPKYRDHATLRVGIESSNDNKLRWIKPRKGRDWTMSIRERVINRLYGL